MIVGRYHKSVLKRYNVSISSHNRIYLLIGQPVSNDVKVNLRHLPASAVFSFTILGIPTFRICHDF